MKKHSAFAGIILLAGLLSFSCKTLKSPQKSAARITKADTGLYIEKNIIGNKEKYINKKLSVLLNDLPAPILSYVPGADFNNKNSVPGLDLSFFDPNTTNNMVGKDSPKRMIVEIAFDQPVSKQDVNKLFSVSHGNWSSADEAFFESKIVKGLWYIK